MKDNNINKCITTIAVLFAVSCHSLADTFIPVNHPSLRYIGRTEQADDHIRYTYPGVQIKVNFNGTFLKMKVKPNSGYYMVEIDKQKPYKLQSPETDSVMTVAEKLRQGLHHATITYISEGLTFRPAFYGFFIDNDGKIAAASKLPKRKIEFIGNSITCGFGIEGKEAKEAFSYATENQFYTYAAVAARNLNAQCFVVARSGIGIYRNCNGKPTGDVGVMPDVYPYTQFGTTGEKWDFERYTPNVVCINLGTNDTTKPSYDTDLLFNAFWNFYKTVRHNYPDAKIVFLTGSMIKKDSKRLKDLTKTLNKVKADAEMLGDGEVYRFDFTPEDGSLGYGSCYHPSLARQAKMGEELTKFLKKIMKW